MKIDIFFIQGIKCIDRRIIIVLYFVCRFDKEAKKWRK